MQRIAFFDIDGTIFRSSLLIELVDALIAQHVFTKDAEDMFCQARIAWEHRESSYEAYIGSVVDAYMKHIQGVHSSALSDVGRAVIAQKRRRIYRYTRDLMKDLRTKGYAIMAISQSPQILVDEFCSSYDFDACFGRVYEVDTNQRFTGSILNLDFIRDKSRVVKHVFDTGLYTHEDSLAVGDTDGDIPLLAAVQKPIAFNPNQMLYDHARQAGWPIVVERKDVIYTSLGCL